MSRKQMKKAAKQAQKERSDPNKADASNEWPQSEATKEQDDSVLDEALIDKIAAS
jgi:hypothetical protein